jgi:hydroxybutyrate-dimer hydrolase
MACRTSLEPWLAAAVAMLPIAGPAWPASGPDKPDFIHGEVVVTRYDAAGGNDLLTGGLGAEGLSRPLPVLPAAPTAEQLRTATIHSNYRALVDVTGGGGYGRLYGPLVAPTTADATGRIFGAEYLAYARGRGGDQNVALMVQIPDAFEPARACIVAAPSSGSRGVYGAIGTAGEWGLKRGCAVAYTDKGTGTGAHDLGRDSVNRLRGERADADAAGEFSSFTADVTDAERAAFDARYPNRWAWKHAHSQRNPEADWDQHVVLSLRFALWAVNHKLAVERGEAAPRLDWDDVLVIASSVSNGGGASLRAAEIAPRGMIDGVVVSEPNVTPRFDPRFVIRQGGGAPLVRHSRPLYDYLTLVNVFQGCANRALENLGAPGNTTPAALGEDRCRSLAQAGLLRAADIAGQAVEAQAILNGYGLLEAQNLLQPSYWAFYVPQAVAVSYANAYARASVVGDLCGFSFAATGADGAPVPLPSEAEARLFGVASGIPPTGGVNVVNNLSPGGPRLDRDSRSPSSDRTDQNLDGALCLRSLQTGQHAVGPLSGEAAASHVRVQAGIAQILATGRLRGVPTIVLHGRSDGLIAPNHSSRPYYALSRLRDGDGSAIRYYEVVNAHHFDAFNALPGFSDKFVPLHYYLIKALDLMYEHLTRSAALPPSQVVRTTARGSGQGGAVPPIEDGEAGNLRPIRAEPSEADRIRFDGSALSIPE